MPTPPSGPHRLRHLGWSEPERRPAMAATEDARPDLGLSNRMLARRGVPWIPVSGEVHYSRLPREQWERTLRLLRAGGVTVVSTYVFWIHHQEQADQPAVFDGNRDVAAFVRLCQELDLDVIVRIGPWCHGEVRNGGLPDWVVRAELDTRTDDPAYLTLVRSWWEQLGPVLAPLCGPTGPILGLQLENELYDQPQHIVTLKRIAREVGLSAPLWTATAWGSADLPVGEVFPLYGGYSDGFWVDTADGWDDTFRAHFHFSAQWDDPGIGKDLAGVSWSGTPGAKHPDFPAATCELGGGMATAYHRRPVVSAADLAALAQVKLGSGSAWQGYYMFCGGTNPVGLTTLQESHATGYPNDLPVFDYDFQAPVGAHAQTRESFHRLRLQHAFLAVFGDRLAPMSATIPEPAEPVRDRASLRWSLRSDGRSGFLFTNNHQPYEQLPDRRGLEFALDLADGTVTLPHRPVDLPAGTITCWPIHIDVAGVLLRWATVDLLTVLEGEGEDPVLVAVKKDGVDAHLAVPAGTTVQGHGRVVDGGDGEVVLEHLAPGREPITLRPPDGSRLHLLVLDERSALDAWTPVVDGRRWLVIAPADVFAEGDGVRVVTSGPTTVEVLDVGDGTGTPHFDRHTVDPELGDASVVVQQSARATAPPEPVITVPGRASAPTPEQFASCAARFQVLVRGLEPGVSSLLRLEIVGDVAVARVRGRSADVFWDGRPWDIDVTTADGSTEVEVDVQIYPLQAGTPVWLPAPAAATRAGLTEPTARIDAATVTSRRAMTVALDHRPDR